MYREFTAVALFALAGLAHADEPVDWKVYAFSAAPRDVALFYLSSDIVRAGGKVQVWIKALEVKKLEADSNIKTETVLKNTTVLLLKAYQPPVGSIAPLTKDQVTMITAYEQMADVGSIAPRAKILYEIDCAEKLVRVLSTVLSMHSDNTVRPWEHVAPETPLAALSKLTCKPS